MDVVNIVDARMGRGKTAAALRMMKESPPREMFLYITRYPDEVADVCKPIGYADSRGDLYLDVKAVCDAMDRGCNVATTPEVILSAGGELLNVAKRRGFNLVVDGEFNPVRTLEIDKKDASLLLNNFLAVEPTGKAVWKESYYTGNLAPYKGMCDLGALYINDGILYSVMSPSILKWFNSAWFFMYMFEKSQLNAYLDRFGFKYEIYGIVYDDNGPRIMKGPDIPDNIDFRKYIHMSGDPPMNIWEERTVDTSDANGRYNEVWTEKLQYDDRKMKYVRDRFLAFTRRYFDCTQGKLIWTTHDGCESKYYGPNSRFKESYIPIRGEDGEPHNDANIVAFLANVFVPRPIYMFYNSINMRLSHQREATIVLLNFLWRSAVRDGKPIVAYIPSKRMRGLLTSWFVKQAGKYISDPWLGLDEWMPFVRIAYERAAAKTTNCYGSLMSKNLEKTTMSGWKKIKR